MKAILTLGSLILFCLFAIITGCGGNGAGGPHIGSPIGPFLFMVGQTSDNLFTFRGSDSGAISPLASTATGHAPSAVVMESFSIDQMNLYVTNSATNSLNVLSLNSTSGMVSQTGITVPTGVNPVALGLRPPFGNGQPDRGDLYVLNQGSNTISGFRISDVAGHMTEVPGSPFATQANPQALLVVSNGPADNPTTFVYVANGALGTISGFKANTDGSLTQLAGSPFPAGANISALATRQLSGGVLLASDAGNNKLLGFKIDSSSGTLTPFAGGPVDAGTHPGTISFTLNDVVYVANQGSNNVSAYKFDSAAATLTPVAGSPFAVGTNPVALGIARPQQLYVANQGSSDISGFNIDFNTGALTPMAGSPFHTPTPPSALQTLWVMNVD